MELRRQQKLFPVRCTSQIWGRLIHFWRNHELYAPESMDIDFTSPHSLLDGNLQGILRKIALRTNSGGKSRCRFKGLCANSRDARAGNFPRGAGNFGRCRAISEFLAGAPQNGVSSCEARDLESCSDRRYFAQPREAFCGDNPATGYCCALTSRRESKRSRDMREFREDRRRGIHRDVSQPRQRNT